MLHPTALIHRDAQLGAGVTVGPYAVIEGAARIGDGCVIQAHAIIGAHVVMGRENLIGYGAIIGGEPQDFAFQPSVKSEVHIGDGNKIREYATIHRGTAEGSATVVGSGCFLMAGAHVAHNCHVGDHVVIANNALLAGHVAVGERAFIGGGCVFHQFVRIGRLAICQGGAAFSKDLPPFTTGTGLNSVAGLNSVGLRREPHLRAEATFLRQLREVVPAESDLFLDMSLGGAKGCWCQLLLGERAIPLHNLTFLNSASTTSREVFVVTNGLNRVLLDRLGEVTPMLDSGGTGEPALKLYRLKRSPNTPPPAFIAKPDISPLHSKYSSRGPYLDSGAPIGKRTLDSWR